MTDCAEEVYRSLIAPIEERMLATVSRIVRDPEDAADTLQEVLAVVWRKLRKIHRHPNPHAYIMRICITRSYDALRKRVRRRALAERSQREEWEMPQGSRPERRETMALVHQAIASLPTRQGQAILLRLIEGATYETIGKILACSPATARSHVSKGKERLRVLLTDAGVL